MGKELGFKVGSHQEQLLARLSSPISVHLFHLISTSSSEFFHALEQALLHGRLVLVKGVASTLDPALQPLVELGHTWHSDTGTCVWVGLGWEVGAM